MKPALRLRAVAPGDYDVLAACLQDALMPPAEMAFRPRERRFVAVFDRFMWERADRRGPRFMVRSALRFEGVGTARSRAVARGGGAPLELLTLVPEPGALSLMFAGGGAIRLEGAAIEAWLEDLAEPRRAPVAPSHAECGGADRAGGGRRP